MPVLIRLGSLGAMLASGAVTTTRYLIGGGWDEGASGLLYGPFLADAGRRAGGPNPTVACLLVDEGDGAQDFVRYEAALRRAAPCTPVPVLVPLGGTLDPAALDGVDALLVGGGLTPAYQEALAAVRDGPARLPYAGFSAGAAVAAREALVGGWLAGGVQVCPEETGEDLEEIEVRPGLGLVPFTVDVHAAQWGTLPRLIEAVRRGGTGAYGVAIDENTMLAVDGARARVSGLGRVHAVRGAEVRAYGSGESFDVRPET
jgi:cyanophycinase